MSEPEKTVPDGSEPNAKGPKMIVSKGSMTVCWPSIDLAGLDWQQTPVGTPAPRSIAIVQDADSKTWLVQQDEKGDWREMLDGELLGKVTPVRWAVPTWDMVEALAFG